jgi:hypothetical protein
MSPARKKELVSPDVAAVARRQFDEQLAATERLIQEFEARIAQVESLQERRAEGARPRPKTSS